jgi:hypothetical protein
LFAGGRFYTAGAVSTDGVAEVDARTGQLVPGFAVHGVPDDALGPDPLVSGGSLFLHWTTYKTGPDPLGHAMAFSVRTGARRRAFAPRPIPMPSYDEAWAAEGGRVYAAHVTEANETIWSQYGIDVLSAHSGSRIAHYDLPYPGYVDDLEPHGNQLFVAGSFRRYWPDGRPRHLATMSVNPLTGAINEVFDAHTDGPVGSLEDRLDRLFVMGYYSHAYGRKRSGFAQVYDNTGAINADYPRFEYFAFDVGGGFLGTSTNSGNKDLGVLAFTGERVFTVPDIRNGFRGSDYVRAPGGLFTTGTLEIPEWGGGADYDVFAGFLAPVY